jgi:hypothetical protein
MAGEWIKFEASTPEKQEVFSITVAMGWDDPDLTVGKLLKVWRWFDQQTVDGNAPRVTSALMDRIIGVTGFAEAMCDVGWLISNEDGLSLPNFDRHNGETAKKRALTAKRVAKHKGNAKGNGDANAAGVTGALPKEEKRREEKKEDDNSASAAAAAAVVVVDLDPAEPDSPRAAPMPPREDPPESVDPVTVLSVALRKLGVNATFAHPTVQDWATRKVPMAVLHAAVATAREQKGPDAKIPPNYLVRIVEDLLNPPAASVTSYGKPPAAPIQIRKPSGMDPKGTDESYEEFDARIAAAEAARRKGSNP